MVQIYQSEEYINSLIAVSWNHAEFSKILLNKVYKLWLKVVHFIYSRLGFILKVTDSSYF